VSLSNNARRALCAVAILFHARTAWAQDPAPTQDPAPAQDPPATPPAEPPTAPPTITGEPIAPDPDAAEHAAKEQARAAFLKGVEVLKAGKPDVALPYLLRSRALFPTKNATINAILCLSQLGRHGDELELQEALLRDFTTLTAEEKKDAQLRIAELRTVLGTIVIDGAPIGAAIVIDGRNRADFPAVAPLYVPAGAHVVRVYKELFEPFETRLDVAGGQTVRVTAKLRALSTSGRLRVVERKGMALDVVIDGVPVGVTPWEGALAVGAHVVALRGEKSMGTQPAKTRVTAQQVTQLTLDAEKLEASLLINTTPAGAAIAIDSVEVGRGIWEGRLRSGPHRLEVAADGFVVDQREISLDARHETLQIELERDPDAAQWRKPSRVVLEVGGALGIAPMLGGDVADACQGTCNGTLGLGAMVTGYGGYELGSGIGFGVSAGYLFASRRLESRPVDITPMGLPARAGVADETLQLSGVLVGAAASLRTGDRFPILARFGVGGLFGEVGDARRARFPLAADSVFDAPEIIESHTVNHLYLAPEVRLGLRVTDRAEVGVSVAALVLIALSTPRWGAEDARPVLLPAYGYSTYPDESLQDSLSVILTPGLSARYAF
jgi:PEGA domain